MKSETLLQICEITRIIFPIRPDHRPVGVPLQICELIDRTVGKIYSYIIKLAERCTVK